MLLMRSHIGRGNSLTGWWRRRNPFRVMFNFSVVMLCKYIPSLRVKRLLYRTINMKVGRDVSVGLGAVMDVFYPELIEIGDNSVIGFNSAILAHEFLVDQWRTGRVRIGKNVLIGAWTLVLPGVTIGDSAKVAAYSLVNQDVKPGEFVGGVPARKISKG